jgi:non-specific serine/threonine protein kinase/serine/threonine-protein kinase
LPRVAANRRLEPRRLANLVRGELDWISMKCLEKDRERRYESADGLASDLQRYLSNEPVQACPPTARYRLSKFARKYRAVLAATAAFVILLTAASIISTCQAIRAARAEQGAIAGWKEADKQRDQANDVNQFMYDVLTSVEPDEKGADVRLVEVLDDATKTASQRFATNPVQEGNVRIMLGQVYTRLDMQRAATAEYDKAVKLLQSGLKADDRRLLNARFQHARSLLNQSANRPAAKILEELMPKIRAALGPDDILLLDAERLQAVSMARAGRYNEAARELRKLRKRAESIGADDWLHIGLLDSLIQVLRMEFNHQPDENHVVLGEMEALANEMVERAVRTLGNDAVQTLRSRVIVADLKYQRGNFQAASDICSEILATSEDRLGKTHIQRLLAMDVLAKAKHRLGDSASAAELTLQALESSRDQENAIVRISSINSALPILDRGGRWTEGESLAREFSAELTKLGGGHGNMLFVADLFMARFVSLLGRTDESNGLFKALQLRVGETADDHLVLARLYLYQGSHLRMQKSFDAAEKEIQLAATTVPDIRLGTSLLNPDDIIVEFIALYDEWGKLEKAAEYRAMLSDIYGALSGASPDGK